MTLRAKSLEGHTGSMRELVATIGALLQEYLLPLCCSANMSITAAERDSMMPSQSILLRGWKLMTSCTAFFGNCQKVMTIRKDLMRTLLNKELLVSQRQEHWQMLQHSLHEKPPASSSIWNYCTTCDGPCSACDSKHGWQKSLKRSSYFTMDFCCDAHG